MPAATADASSLSRQLRVMLPADYLWLALCRPFICQAKRPYEGYESYYAWLTDQYKRKRCVDGERL